MLRLIKDHGGNEPDKWKYKNIITSQLSSYELVILFYLGLTPKYQDLKALLEQLKVLENVDFNLLIAPAKLTCHYEKNAFGRNPDASRYYSDEPSVG